MKLHETKFSSHLKWEQNNFIQGGEKKRVLPLEQGTRRIFIPLIVRFF
jgi:hypothetical protein